MKKALLTLILISITVSANALVADKFKCSMDITDFNSSIRSSQEKEFFIARLPELQSTPTDIHYTTGGIQERMSLDTPQGTFGANLNFYYTHALRNDSHGQLEARQSTCVGLTTDFCPKNSSGQGITTCSTFLEACMQPALPFDPNLGWTPTTLLGTIPAFNPQGLGSTIHNIGDKNNNIVGSIVLTCRHIGTFY